MAKEIKTKTETPAEPITPKKEIPESLPRTKVELQKIVDWFKEKNPEEYPSRKAEFDSQLALYD